MQRHHIIRGIPFPNVNFFSKEKIEGTLDYFPRDGDIIVASFPKTGSVWVCYIVLQITSKGQTFPTFTDFIKKLVPNMEMVGPEGLDNLTGVRTYKHHYRYDIVKKNPKSKIIYTYRNPADIIVSYHHFLQELWEEPIDFDEFFNDFLTGNIEYGSYFEHFLSYFAHKDDDNLLLISYEELLENPKEGVLKIALFLGEEYFQYLLENESVLEKIVDQTNFENMKKTVSVQVPHQIPTEKSSENARNTVNFFRKGVIGDGKQTLSPDQLSRLRQVASKYMKDNEILQEWFKE